jgi:hypothetical protein
MTPNFQNNLHSLARILFSVAFLIIGVVFTCSGDAVRQCLGAGFLGTVIGYWVK